MHLRPNRAYFQSVARPSGFTLVEILVATTLTLILMTAVVTVFGGVGEGIAKSRRALEQFDRLRTVGQQLRMDLAGATVKFDGSPVRPEEGQGYFEYIENGQNGPLQAWDTSSGTFNVTAGPQGYINHDVLMFTTRNAAQPFVGRYAYPSDPLNPTLQSDVAEVVWFLRGNTLHRRVLLVAPGTASAIGGSSKTSFYANNNISVHVARGQIVPNSLGDLTKRENRYGHPASTFPFDARLWGCLGLPTLAECTSTSWMSGWTNGSTPPPPAKGAPNVTQVDLWDSSGGSLSVAKLLPDQLLNPAQDGTRVADNVVLTNVISFDVKVWEPASNPQNGNAPGYAPGYVDLGYGNVAFSPSSVPPQGPTNQHLNHTGSPKSGLVGPPCVLDSYCFSYENEGIYNINTSGTPVPLNPNPQVNHLVPASQYPPPHYPAGLGQWPAGTSTNGLADVNQQGQPGYGIVDSANELITQPPYPVPVRGIQIKIRCFEPDSRQVREITIEHDFLPK